MNPPVDPQPGRMYLQEPVTDTVAGALRDRAEMSPQHLAWIARKRREREFGLDCELGLAERRQRIEQLEDL